MLLIWNLCFVCESLIYLNLFSFNTQKLIKMGYMFHSYKSLSNLNLSIFNTENVINMEKIVLFM